MAHNDGLGPCVREGSHLHVSLLCVGNGEHAGVLRVQCAQAIRIVARVQAVNQRQVCEVVDVGFDGEDDDHAVETKENKRCQQMEEDEE